jgi:hypothetical protein
MARSLVPSSKQSDLDHSAGFRWSRRCAYGMAAHSHRSLRLGRQQQPSSSRRGPVAIRAAARPPWLQPSVRRPAESGIGLPRSVPAAVWAMPSWPTASMKRPASSMPLSPTAQIGFTGSKARFGSGPQSRYRPTCWRRLTTRTTSSIPIRHIMASCSCRFIGSAAGS